MNNILLSELNQANISKFFKILSKDADLQNVALAGIDISRLTDTMRLCTDASFFITECDASHKKTLRPVGVMLCSVSDANAEILLIYISPKYRHSHLGHRMLSHGLDLLRHQGVQTVSLDVLSDNTAAIRLYCSSGFSANGTVVTLRNETSSFYCEPKNITLKQTSSLLIMPTLRMFNGSTSFRKDIYSDITYLSSLTDCNQAEFVTVQHKHKTVGYFIFSRKHNILRIHQFGLHAGCEYLVFEVLSALIDSCTIVLLQISGGNTAMIERFKKNGFYIDFMQEQYIKTLKNL